jgi:hypothetical protein
MIYFAVFKENGERVTTYIEGIHANIPKEAIAITEEDQALYVTNEYIRGANGKPMKKPPYIPSEAELLQAYRSKRDVLIELTDKPMLLIDYTVNGKVLTETQRKELLAYRQALRDAPTLSYPEFPVPPVWLQ